METATGTPRTDGIPGAALPGAAPGSSATKELLEEQLRFLAEVKPLLDSVVSLAKARGELLLCLGLERTRLFIGRQFAWLVALVLFSASWIFLMMSMWRGANAITHQEWAGPLVVGLVHFIAGAMSLSWRKKLRL